MRQVSVLCSALLALSLAARASEDGPVVRRLKLPGGGALDLPAPPAWRVEATRLLGVFPPTISFSPAEGKGFSVQITVISNLNNDPHFNDPKTVSQLVAKARDKAVESATSRHIPIFELKAEHLAGYYFTATDRMPDPDGWRYMTNGAAAFYDLLLTFTVLSNDPEQPEAASTLAMLQKARRVGQ